MNIEIKDIIFAVLILAIIIICIIVGRKIARSVKAKVNKAKEIIDQIQKVTDETATTPKTLSGVEDLMKQRILKDFPDFNFDVCREMVSSAIVNYFNVLNNKDDGLDSLRGTCTPSFVNEVQGESAVNTTVYDGVRVHKTVISEYRRNRDESIVTYQSAVEYARRGKGLMQYVYQTKLVRYLTEDNAAGVLTLRCPYCNAPVESVGENKTCIYCGSAILAEIVTAEKVWRVNKIAKLR